MMVHGDTTLVIPSSTDRTPKTKVQITFIRACMLIFFISCVTYNTTTTNTNAPIQMPQSMLQSMHQCPHQCPNQCLDQCLDQKCAGRGRENLERGCRHGVGGSSLVPGGHRWVGVVERSIAEPHCDGKPSGSVGATGVEFKNDHRPIRCVGPPTLHENLRGNGEFHVFASIEFGQRLAILRAAEKQQQRAAHATWKEDGVGGATRYVNMDYTTVTA